MIIKIITIIVMGIRIVGMSECTNEDLLGMMIMELMIVMYSMSLLIRFKERK